LARCNRVCDSVSGSYQLEPTDRSGTLNAFVSRRILKLPRYTLFVVYEGIHTEHWRKWEGLRKPLHSLPQ